MRLPRWSPHAFTTCLAFLCLSLLCFSPNVAKKCLSLRLYHFALHLVHLPSAQVPNLINISNIGRNRIWLSLRLFPASFRTWDKTWIDSTCISMLETLHPFAQFRPHQNLRNKLCDWCGGGREVRLLGTSVKMFHEANVETILPIPCCMDKAKDAALLFHHRLHGLQHIGIETLLSLLKLQMHVQPGSSDWIALIKSFKCWKWTEQKQIDWELVLLDCLCIAD